MRDRREPLAILNELSTALRSGIEEEEVIAAISTFASMMRAVAAVRRDIQLASTAPFGEILFPHNQQTLAGFAFAKGGRTRDEWRYIQSRRNHAPFAVAPALERVCDAEEFLCAEKRAVGLGLAVANRQLAVSLFDRDWPDPVVGLERFWLEESGDGELVERTEAVKVKHASTDAHVAAHRQFILDLALPVVFTGLDIWNDRRSLYPCLRFLPRVEAQLRGYASGEALRQIARRLRELNDSIDQWDRSTSPSPRWRSKVTPEGGERKLLCMFMDLDGEERCFDLHARFTPGPGRIHFRLDRQWAAIAHVGRKL